MILVDKPKGLSSHAVIAKVRRLCGVKRVGHAGTLDPQASGLLIVLIGRDFTKQAASYLKLDKSYEVELKLGETSESGDSEGPISAVSNKRPTLAEVKKTLDNFKGEIEQVPPRYSAIKLQGVTAYKRARRGEEFELKPRQVTIYGITKVIYKYPFLRFTVKVSSGTYIRSLASDIGSQLNTGAYLANLRRVQIGKFSIKQASNLDNLAANWYNKQYQC